MGRRRKKDGGGGVLMGRGGHEEGRGCEGKKGDGEEGDGERGHKVNGMGKVKVGGGRMRSLEQAE